MEITAINQEFSRLASPEQVEKAAHALEARGIQAIVVETGAEARECALSLIPAGAEVYNPPSRTIDQIGLTADIMSSTRFQPVRERLHALDRATQQRKIRQAMAAPDVVIGSVHAITEDGEVLVASYTGSQLSSVVFGAGRVIWVAGTQKIVASLYEGYRRIREYSYPLENARTQEVYGQASALHKILLVNGEQPGRISVILVKQNLGF